MNLGILNVSMALLQVVFELNITPIICCKNNKNNNKKKTNYNKSHTN